jgi:4-hydroxy-tetrahydrodipicolinate synthase
LIQFGEVITAMVTPFNNKKEVDISRTKELVSYLIKNGTDSIVVSGTTGESPTLSKEEKMTLFKTVKNSVTSEKVIANIGSNDTIATIRFAKEVERENAADALLLVTPYYNKPSQDGLYQHFKAIANATNLPIMLYNIPGRTSVNLNTDTIIRLSKIRNIVSIKESSGNLSQIATVIENTDNDFTVYSGDDNLTLPILSVGGEGIVSVASHLAGGEIKRMISLYKEGEVCEASSIHRKLLPFFEGLFFTTNPVPIKTALNYKGINVGGVRLPLVELKPFETIKLKKILKIIETPFL